MAYKNGRSTENIIGNVGCATEVIEPAMSPVINKIFNLLIIGVMADKRNTDAKLPLGHLIGPS